MTPSPEPVRSRSPRRLRLLLALVACVVAAPSLAQRTGARGRAPAAAARAVLDTADARRWARLLAVVDSRALDTATVDDALAGGSRVRARAALAIGQVGMRDRYPVLRRLVADEDTLVAANAAFALGLARDTGAVEALGDILDRRDAAAAEAAWALGRIGEPSRGPLLAALRRKSVPPGPTTAAILIALGRLRPVPVDAVVPWIGAGDRDVAWAAAYAVARNRVAGGVRPLLARAGSPDAGERALVALALQKPTAGDSLADTARLVLRALARDPHPHVRVNVARALASWGSGEREGVLALARDRDPNVRVAARQSLRGVLAADDSAWARLWDEDSSLVARRAVATAEFAAGRGETSIMQWAGSPRWQERHALVDAYAAAPSAGERLKAYELWLDAGEDGRIGEPDGRVRTALVALLAGTLDSAAHDSAARAHLRAVIARDSDPFARAAALGILAPAARVADIPVVLDSWRTFALDRDNDAAIAAMRLLAGAWRRDSANWPDSLRARVAALPRPRDPLVRGAARGLSLVSWAGDDREPMPASVARHERLVRDRVVPALAGRLPRVGIVTARGTVVLELFAADAPMTVENLLALAGRRYFDGLAFHRVVPNFVAQDGDPRGDGNGGPGYAIRDEHNRNRYARGVLGMALSGPHTGGSQWFVTHSPQPHLDGDYTVFGRVVRGWEVLDRLVQGDRILRIRREVDRR